MNKLIQIKLPAHEKLVFDQIAKSEGFRSTASFAYYAIKQQIKRIQKENIIPKATKTLKIIKKS